MSARKKYDAVIKTGTYTDAQGNEKGRYQNVGAVLVNDEDRPFLVLEPWFNPAGAANQNGQVFVSLFEPKSRQQSAQSSGQQGGGATGGDEFDSDIPF
ncbi:MAG: hypothetical protein ABEH64_12980 [Salinirussus sp.]